MLNLDMRSDHFIELKKALKIVLEDKSDTIKGYYVHSGWNVGMPSSRAAPSNAIEIPTLYLTEWCNQSHFIYFDTPKSRKEVFDFILGWLTSEIYEQVSEDCYLDEEAAHSQGFRLVVDSYAHMTEIPFKLAIQPWIAEYHK